MVSLVPWWFNHPRRASLLIRQHPGQFGAADRAGALRRAAAVFERDLFHVFDLALLAALDAVRFRRHSALPSLRDTAAARRRLPFRTPVARHVPARRPPG